MNDNRNVLEGFFRSRSGAAMAVKGGLFRRWLSQSSPATHGIEFLPRNLLNRVVAPDLNVVSIKSAALPAFVIVSLEGLDVGGVVETLAAINGLSLSSRICIAADYETLGSLDKGGIDETRIGFLLDKVNADTPLAHIADDSIEVVRFDPAFALRAVNHFRSGCMLEAMLVLTRNLGLCTLGPAMPPCEDPPALAFDYFPEVLG